MQPKHSRKDILRRAISCYGADNQIIKAIEEMSELTKALCKSQIDGGPTYNIMEEIADVRIMLEQLCIIFDLDTGEVEDRKALPPGCTDAGGRKMTREVVGACSACGEVIYAGESIRRDDGHLLHDDPQCLWEWVETNWPIRELLDGVGIVMEVA